MWPRIDQKTCFKSMFTANLIPIVIEPILINEELTTNIEEVNKQIELIGHDNILCIFSTTSCFAPRGYDNIKELSIISRKNKIFHVINNAYGIYCTKVVDILNQSAKVGNMDILISSTDKNFMVPVGGSLIYSSNEDMINKIKKNYPGRASLGPVLDLFITLLDMGKNKYKLLIAERKDKYKKLKEKMQKVALKYNERIMEIPNNKISLAMSLQSICKSATGKSDVTYLGSLFYFRQISGIRVISQSPPTDFNGYKFSNFGSNAENYPIVPYCSFACAIGITDDEIDGFVNKFVDIVDSYISQSNLNKNLDTSMTTKSNDSSLGKESKLKNKESNKEKHITPKKFEQMELVISQVENININI
jgi:O-phospho-L-seryl-tRNASec:L-selenocysteinyl-tRNA synthase